MIERVARETAWHTPFDIAATKRAVAWRATTNQGMGIYAAMLGGTGAVFLLYSLTLNADFWVLLIELQAIMTGIAWTHSLRSNAGKSTEADERMIEDPNDETTLLVEVETWQFGGLTGTDRGFLCIDEDRLIFSGHRSSFALGASDTRGVSVGHRGYRLRFSLAARPEIELRVSTIERVNFHNERFGVRILASVRQMMKRGAETFEAVQLPPLSMDPLSDVRDLVWMFVKSVSWFPASCLGWFLIAEVVVAMMDSGALQDQGADKMIGLAICIPFLIGYLYLLFNITWRTCSPLAELAGSILVRRRLNGAR